MVDKTVKIVSVGGSIIIPKSGFDIEFLKKFRALIVDRVKKGEKFILVIGGGATCRQYQEAARQVVPLTDEDLDWIGIKTTVFNAEFVKFLFKEYAHTAVATNPTKKIKTNKPIIIGAGWKPGCSTDKDAVLLAKTYGAKEVINLSNIDYVYDSDPRTNSNARKIEKASWKEMRKIVGDKWTPGANVPFDPMAAKNAEKLKLVIKFVKGTNLDQVEKALTGKAYSGTIIGQL
ncbi:MAG TPA: UMP kinase [Patescibacteria group bacterium]|nr:UMP kinase [Patescibacteria group bacterium]